MPLDFDVSFRTHGASTAAPGPDDAPLRIAVLGDFSGTKDRRNSPDGTPSRKRCHRIDVDTVESVMATVAPALTLQLGTDEGSTVSIEPREMESFHPDALHENLPVFAALRDLRTRLQDPTTFADAAAQLTGSPTASEDGVPLSETPTASAANADAGDLDGLLSRKVTSGATHEPRLRRQSVADSLIRAAVGDRVIPTPDPRLEHYLDHVDAAAGDILRSILHHPQFQSLEAAWRGIDFLIRRMDPEDVDIHLVDITVAELATGVDSSPDRSDGLGAILGTGPNDVPGEAPWDLVIGLYWFGADAADIARLSRLGQAARGLQCTFLAGATPALLGVTDVDALSTPHAWSGMTTALQSEWDRLRGSPAGRHLCLSLPRFLLRLPYGRKGEPVDTAGFEEMSSPVRHEDFLWGNPALLTACAWIADKLGSGDGPTPGYGSRQVEDIAYFTYEEDGLPVALPCGDIWLPDRSAEQLLAQGLTPVRSIRGMDSVLLVLTSLAGEPLC